MPNIDLEEVFKINEDYTLVEHTNDYVIIDNIYVNPDKVLEYVETLPKFVNRSINDQEINKYDQYRKYLPTHCLNIEKKKLNAIVVKYAREYFPKNSNIEDEDYVFINFENYLKDRPNNIQCFPHKDKGNITGLIYIDNIEDGGTMLYEKPVITESNKKTIEDIIDKNGSFLRDVTPLILKKKIQHKQNRLIIFKGGYNLHGGWIDDYNKYYNKKRIAQVMFTMSVK